MRLELDRSLDVFDVFLLMEAIARLSPDHGELVIEDEEATYPQTVSLGLDQAMYRAVYPLGRHMLMDVRFPSGDSASYAHWEPHSLAVSGTERFEQQAARLVQEGVARMQGHARVLAFSESMPLRERPAGDVMRALFRAAAGRRASFFLTDRNLNGKLVRVSSVWLLGSYSRPIDAVLRFAQGGFLVYHVESGAVYATEDLYYDVKSILKEIL